MMNESEMLLRDKPVLCVIDTRSVQKYMFHANGLEESVGAEAILQTFPVDSLQYAVEHITPPLKPDEYVLSCSDAESKEAFYIDKKIKVQVLDFAATNMILIFRTGRLCCDVVRKMARYYLDMAYSLQFTSACTEWTGDMPADMQSLFRNLAESKRRSPGAHPVGPFSIVRVERNTGEPVAFVDSKTGEEFSRVALLRRSGYARLRKGTKERNVRMLRCGDTNFYAVAHIDGNNMGAQIMQLSYSPLVGPDSFHNRRIVSQRICKTIGRAIAAATADVKDAFGFADAQMEYEVKIFQSGGDDLNIAASPEVVFTFVERYLVHLSDTPLWEDAQHRVCISSSAGIVIVEEGTDYIKALNYAEECCARAKDAAKAEHNLVNGRAGNWLDYRIVYPDRPEDSEADRSEAYVASDGTGLMLRPYCIDPAFRESSHGYESLWRRVEALMDMKMDSATLSTLMLVCGMGISETDLFCRGLAVNGTSVVDLLGEPIVCDRDRNYVAWYDALELYGFMRQTDWRILR